MLLIHQPVPQVRFILPLLHRSLIVCVPLVALVSFKVYLWLLLVVQLRLNVHRPHQQHAMLATFTQLLLQRRLTVCAPFVVLVSFKLHLWPQLAVLLRLSVHQSHQQHALLALSTLLLPHNHLMQFVPHAQVVHLLHHQQHCHRVHLSPSVLQLLLCVMWVPLTLILQQLLLPMLCVLVLTVPLQTVSQALCSFAHQQQGARVVNITLDLHVLPYH